MKGDTMQMFDHNGTQNISFPLGWEGKPEEVAFSAPDLRRKLLQFAQPLYAVLVNGRVGLADSGNIQPLNGKLSNLAGWLPPLSFENSETGVFVKPIK
jgi:hypothetical protein